MTKFEVTILGNNSAFPAQGRNPSAQVVNYNDELFLVDCGEGTQIRMSQYGVKRARINHIFISHLHGDHVFGLPGLINSYQHLTRKSPLHIYGPAGVRQMIETVLRLSKSMIHFDIVFHELHQEEKQKIFESKLLRVYTFPLKHRVPTFGYLFQERVQPGGMNKDIIEKYNLSVQEIKALKAGDDVTLEDNRIVRTAEALDPPPQPRSFAYCSDTIFDKEIVPWIEHATLLYHEATFLHGIERKARESMHSTALQAGTIAHLANVGKLLIGHFSSRYDDLSPLREEAQEIFMNTEIAEEGVTYLVAHK
jgi:ribonuclease Z